MFNTPVLGLTLQEKASSSFFQSNLFFRQVLTCSLTFTRGWAPRIDSIKFTSLGAASSAEQYMAEWSLMECSRMPESQMSSLLVVRTTSKSD